MSALKRFGAVAASILILTSIVSAGVMAYSHSPRSDAPIVFSNKDMLQEMWSNYKKLNIEQSSGRTIDASQGSITTSEGESYTMLRAVWMDDQTTFDQSWQWTKDNLQRDDYLMSWKFGKLPDGTYGIQSNVGGQNTATDGDSDIALGLLMAYSRWKEDKYLYDAKPILASMWEREVVYVNEKPVLVANNLERDNETRVLVNPSYMSPYAYKIFAHVDKDHDWRGLADSSYDLLAKASDAKLDASQSSGLPPDWMYVNRTTGALEAATGENLSSNFSYDAIRTPWRLALDYMWFNDTRAKQQLSKYSALSQQWDKDHKLVTSLSRDGNRAASNDSPAVYGATMGYFAVMQPKTAAAIYHDKLSPLYSPDEQKPSQDLSYYDANWWWFGTALYLHQLPNLAAGV